MILETLERYVDADAAAKFLALPRRRILALARSGELPAYPVGNGARRVWRFRLSELSNAIASHQNSVFTSEETNSRRTSNVPQGYESGDPDVAEGMVDKAPE
jgi:hypothetical protein